MTDRPKLNSEYGALLLDVSRAGGRDLAIRLDTYVGELMATYIEAAPTGKDIPMTTRPENWSRQQEMAALEAAAISVEIAVEDWRALLEEMIHPSGPGTSPA